MTRDHYIISVTDDVGNIRISCPVCGNLYWGTDRAKANAAENRHNRKFPGKREKSP